MCLGGRDAKPGITVYRFANRIPLLFEGGADVATQVSKRRINWSSYKIRQNQDKVGASERPARARACACARASGWPCARASS